MIDCNLDIPEQSNPTLLKYYYSQLNKKYLQKFCSREMQIEFCFEFIPIILNKFQHGTLIILS